MPYLYKRMNLRSGPPTPDQKSQFNPSSALRRLDAAYLGERFHFTKDFKVSVRENNDALVSSYLTSMPNVVSLSVEFDGIDASHTCSALLDLPSKALRDLEIRVAVDDSPDSYLNQTQNESEILKLFGLGGNMSARARDIARALIASPQIKVLGLGMDLTTFLDKYHPRFGASESNKELLLKDIIDEMQKSRPGGDFHLSLDELILGLGALPGTPLPVNQTIHDLSPLTSLKSLKVLQLLNGDTAKLEDHPDLLEIEPRAFHACTNLRRLIVDTLSEDIVTLIDFLRSSSTSLVELEVNREQDLRRFVGGENSSMENRLKPIGPRWRKMHLEYPLAMRNLFDATGQNTYSDLEELSLAITTTLLDQLVGREQSESWELVLSHFSSLPGLRRLRLQWETSLIQKWAQRSSPGIASRFATRLFTIHEEAMHSQDLPSNLLYITLKPSNGDVRSFRRMFVPPGFDVGVDTSMEWKLVEVPKDEESDWDWGAGARGNPYEY
ncbi:uncharacterized protein PAC_07344 [Phialocephala subalpina]|uniref:Uncharacterized protein n=1 Tax=Phialocephala subalpina TaxID=576137 RepID=A0A1L7WXI3_9HELO|nr:uncharacterized protein PAC_07344 [Phialocephala subalpina]